MTATPLLLLRGSSVSGICMYVKVKLSCFARRSADDRQSETYSLSLKIGHKTGTHMTCNKSGAQISRYADILSAADSTSKKVVCTAPINYKFCNVSVLYTHTHLRINQMGSRYISDISPRHSHFTKMP
jgi:hypothetical protein